MEEKRSEGGNETLMEATKERNSQWISEGENGGQE